MSSRVLEQAQGQGPSPELLSKSERQARRGPRPHPMRQAIWIAAELVVNNTTANGFAFL
jgi:hypothetical protein